MQETENDILKRVRKIEIKTRGLSNEIFAGKYHTAFRGRGMSFSEVREYRAGDDVRDIDWNVTARSRTPHIKVYEEERELTMMLLVDVSGSRMFGTTDRLKKNLQTEIAAVLAFSASENNDKVGCIFFSDRIEKFIPPKKGRSHILAIIRELVGFEPQSRGTRISEALRFLTNVTKKHCTAFLLSDFLDPGKDRTALEDALKIASGKHDLVGIRVSDPREAELPDVGIVEMKDAETGRKAWVDTSSARVREHYARVWQERRHPLGAQTPPHRHGRGIDRRGLRRGTHQTIQTAMKSIPNNPASTCSPFARNGGIQPSAAAERQNAAQTPPSEAVPVGLRSSGRPKAGRTSITKRVKTALATALLTGLTTVLYAAPPTITARVEPDSIGIGDRFDVVIDVDRDLVQVVEFPTFNPPPQSGLEVVESHPVDTLRRDGRHLSLRKRYTLAAFEEGNLGLGRAQVLYLDKNITDTLYTADTLRLQVGTFQIDSTSHTIYDIKAQRTLPFRYGEISGYVLWSLLGLIVLGGAIYAGRRLMARYARKVRDIFRPAPPLPPHIAAIQALETLHNQKLWQSGRHKQYYSGLTDILRTYLAGRYGFGAMEMTSDEILAAVRRYDLPQKCVMDLQAILRDADLAKFAKAQSEGTTNEDNYLNAYYFVEETKPAEIAEEGTEQDDTQ